MLSMASRCFRCSRASPSCGTLLVSTTPLFKPALRLLGVVVVMEVVMMIVMVTAVGPAVASLLEAVRLLESPQLLRAHALLLPLGLEGVLSLVLVLAAQGGASGCCRLKTVAADEEAGPPTDYASYKLRAMMFAQVLRSVGVAVPDALLARLG